MALPMARETLQRMIERSAKIRWRCDVVQSHYGDVNLKRIAKAKGGDYPSSTGARHVESPDALASSSLRTSAAHGLVRWRPSPTETRLGGPKMIAAERNFRPLVMRWKWARALLKAREEAQPTVLPTDETEQITKRFVIFTTPGEVPKKKGGWLKDEHLIDFLRSVMALLAC